MRFQAARIGTGVIALAVTAIASVVGATPARADAVLDQLHAAAKAEGKVSVLGPPSAQLRQHLSAAFNKRFPDIALEYGGLQGNQIVSKVKSEARAGIHSVDAIITGTTTAYRFLKPEGLLQPFGGWIVSKEAGDPSHWIDGRLGWADPAQYDLAMTEMASPCVVVNDEMVKKGEITKDADLLDPRWKGKIASNDPAVPGNANLCYRRMYELHGEDFLRKLKAQEVTVTRDLRQLVDWVAKGQYPIGIGFSPSATAYFTSKGVTSIRMTDNQGWGDKMILSPGFGSLMVPAKVAHPAAAKLFVNWILTKEGQDAVVKGIEYPSRRLDADNSPAPDFLRRVPEGKYYLGYTEEYITSPDQDKAQAALKNLQLGK